MRRFPNSAADIEVIETANPRTYYDLTRRKLGMVLGIRPGRGIFVVTALSAKRFHRRRHGQLRRPLDSVVASR